MTRRGARQPGGTAPIDPKCYSPAVSTNRAASLMYALAGGWHMLRFQKNTRIMLAATLLVVPLAFWLGIGAEQWAVLILAIGKVWLAEFINGAIEAAVNISAPELHPMAKVAKDVAAAAVLITVAVAVLIGLLLLGPPLAERLLAVPSSS